MNYKSYEEFVANVNEGFDTTKQMKDGLNSGNVYVVDDTVQEDENGEYILVEVDGEEVKSYVSLKKGKGAVNASNKRTRYAVEPPVDDSAVEDAVTIIDKLGWDEKTQFRKNERAVAMALEKNVPFFIIGHAGWGKTSILKSVAKRMGYHIIIVYLDKAQPEDLGGIPVANKNEDGTVSVDFALPSWAAEIHDNPDKKYLLFFDEMNQANGAVLNTLMPIIHERTICGIEFDNFLPAAAGNYSGENTELQETKNDPLMQRFQVKIMWSEKWAEVVEHISDVCRPIVGDTIMDAFTDVMASVKNSVECNIFESPRSVTLYLQNQIGGYIRMAKSGKIKSAKFFSKREIGEEIEHLLRTNSFSMTKGWSGIVDRSTELMSSVEMQAQCEKLAETIYNELDRIIQESNGKTYKNKSSFSGVDDAIFSDENDSDVEGLNKKQFDKLFGEKGVISKYRNYPQLSTCGTLDKVIDKLVSTGKFGYLDNGQIRQNIKEYYEANYSDLK